MNYCMQGLPAAPPMTLQWVPALIAVQEAGSAAPKALHSPLPPAITEHSTPALNKAVQLLETPG